MNESNDDDDDDLGALGKLFKSLGLTDDDLKEAIDKATGEVRAMRFFIECMRMPRDEEEMAICCQVHCHEPARWSYVWLGNVNRMSACDKCMMEASAVSKDIGFDLGDVQEI